MQNKTNAKSTLNASFKDITGKIRRFDLSDYSLVDVKIFFEAMQGNGFELIKFSRKVI